MIKGESVEHAQLRVETAPPNSPERGKVCIVAWDRTPNEPREGREGNARKGSEIRRYK